MAKKTTQGTTSGVDYNSMGIKNSTMDRFGAGAPTDPKLKPIEEKQYGETTTTKEIVDGRTKITEATPWSQRLAGESKSYKEAGVDPQAAKEYWRQNPDKYKEYKKSLTGMNKGQDVNVRYEDIPSPSPVPAEPKAAYYKYRTDGKGYQSIGGDTSLSRAKSLANSKGDIDAVYDPKAYGPGAMGRLIQTSEGQELKSIRSSMKDNPNWRQDLAKTKQKYSDIRQKTAEWKKSGSDPASMPKELSDYQKRINAASQRVQTGTSDYSSEEKAYKMTKFSNNT